jgi:hypothetical protein
MNFEAENFGSSEEALRYIKEKSDDIVEAVIPQSPTIVVREGNARTEIVIGMVLYMVNGHKKIVHPVDAELVLNDGILNRMHIPIKLLRPE